MSVHILEDDPGVADSLKSLLGILGYGVRLYQDGETFLKASPPGEDDVVIVDLGLPGIGGEQVVRWINRLEPRPRVIVISGQPQKVIEEALRDVGGAQVLRKPLSGEILTTMLLG